MKTLQNNFTTPEQSKRLLELGVPADSADCFITRPHTTVNTCVVDVLRDELYSKTEKFTDFFEYLPCWSVGRLMEIITMCHLSKDGRFCFRKDMCESLVETICGFIKYGEMDFSKLEDLV